MRPAGRHALVTGGGRGIVAARCNPHRRLVQPADVAAAVLFLRVAGAAAMPGRAIPVAGGAAT
jgi:NAD(P)-dependent dehydrogenase (short-subunit alcohol dehydrogenase family)